MYFSTVCSIAHCHVIQWSIDSRFHCTKLWCFINCTSSRAWFRWQ
jgi:hypothetical protein